MRRGAKLCIPYAFLMAARVLTAFAHGTFFGVGSVVATGLVAPQKRASAIARQSACGWGGGIPLPS